MVTKDSQVLGLYLDYRQNRKLLNRWHLCALHETLMKRLICYINSEPVMIRRRQVDLAGKPPFHQYLSYSPKTVDRPAVR